MLSWNQAKIEDIARQNKRNEKAMAKREEQRNKNDLENRLAELQNEREIREREKEKQHESFLEKIDWRGYTCPSCGCVAITIRFPASGDKEISCHNPACKIVTSVDTRNGQSEKLERVFQKFTAVVNREKELYNLLDNPPDPSDELTQRILALHAAIGQVALEFVRKEDGG